MRSWDVIVIGSGIGGLVAGGLLARYGRHVLVCESHTIAGGAAHSFVREGFHFDSGPSFHCGLGDPSSLNPLRLVLEALGEKIAAVAYDPLAHYHFPDGAFPVYGKTEHYRAAVARITPAGARELERFEQRLLPLYESLREIPLLALRSDLGLVGMLLSRAIWSVMKLLPLIGTLQGSAGELMDREVRDPWVRRLIDFECFLLSGLKAHGTVAPEMAFMFGERSRSVVDYPLGGSGALIDALVRGLERWGGQLQLGSHVERIVVESRTVAGVRLKNGEVLHAPVVISNASLWDTYGKLLEPEDLPPAFRARTLATPTVASFMHLHLGIRSDGLVLTGHHAVLHDQARDIASPGNTCMISIPSVWDPALAPPGHHVVHAYTLEPFVGWQRSAAYTQRKHERAQSLWRALERVIPDIRERVVLELVGTPLTHAHYLRRYQGTYGPAVPPSQGSLPTTHTPIAGLYRVGDSTLPGIGVPAVAASGILCANTLVSPVQTAQLLEQVQHGAY